MTTNMMTTKVRFTLPASNIMGAEGCALLGEFNNWNMDEAIYLQQQEDGSMMTELELAAGKDFQYRYLLSNGTWVNDDAEKIIAEMNGYPVENCLVKVPATGFKAEVKKVKAASAKTKAVKAKPGIVKEDLTKIEGIGKKIEALLFKNEIRSYKALAKTTVKSLKEILNSAGNKFSIHDPATWPKQAKLAAAAKWEELQMLQEQLKGGK
jgi:predicted flap endonuclease-1-like 5' DNA nuclease